MNKIGTHNSVTGERGSLWSWFLTPFARCQSKTLVEQYKAGCRLFDLRIKRHRGRYYGAHGMWRTREEITDVLWELYEAAMEDKAKVYVMTTYEGRLKGEAEKRDFLECCAELRALYPGLVWGSVFAKYQDRGLTVDWTCIQQGAFLPKSRQGFLPLDGRRWQTWLPIPWLWKKIYHNNPAWSDEVFTYVDFL